MALASMRTLWVIGVPKVGRPAVRAIRRNPKSGLMFKQTPAGIE
jgi:hypothetical protein